MSSENGKPRVAVVMGGPSAEREISMETGYFVMRQLQSLGYEAKSLDFDERFIESLRKISPDVVFIALHGPGGEDGQIQAILDYLHLPYTGSSVEACAMAMDKHITKKLLAAEGLPTAAWDLFDLSGGTLPLLPGSLDLPLVVKPRNEGSAVGVSIVRSHEQWTQTMISFSENYSEVLAEEFIPGREFTCGILGVDALPVIEIIPNKDEFYSYEAKYGAGGSTHICPAKIDGDLAARIQMLALSVHRLLGLRDYSRTDFMVSKEGRPYILEINTLPGLTATSNLPEACLAAGISNEALIDRLITYAMGRTNGRVLA